mmetsp:Transcript_14284/g.19037  ORF Transcript_14284/g.19037 Transcript_14284/m.19037 type:complete len:405 (-) Transcript_14284:176-1390(-)
MTEFWVSQAKYHCKYCKCWMQGDKMSKIKHEQGRRHKECVDDFFRTKREEKQGSAKDDADLKRQLREIERAAAAAVEQDLSSGAVRYSAAASAAPLKISAHARRAPPAPPPRDRIGDRPHSSSNDDAVGFGTNLDEAEGAEKKKEEDNVIPGVYTVRGVTYFEGKLHEDKLRSDVRCEIWLEEREEWLDALIVSVIERSVPNTELKLRSYKVSFTLPEHVVPEQDPSEAQVTTLEDIPSSSLRIISTGTNQFNAPVAAAPMDEDTGFGGWQTVSVRVVNEQEEEEKRIKSREAAAKRKSELDTRKEKQMQLEERYEACGDDALSSFDVFNTGVYKGVKLESTSEEATSYIESVSGGGWSEETAPPQSGGNGDDGAAVPPVAFKKRKKARGGGQGAKKKNFRKKG